MGKHIQEADLKTVNGQSLVGTGDLNIEGGGINPENIGFGLSYKDDKIQLGERLEGLSVEANQIYKEGAYTIFGDFKGFQEGKSRTVLISEENKISVLSKNEQNASSLEIDHLSFNFGTKNPQNKVTSFAMSDNQMFIKVNDKSIEYNEGMVYYGGKFNGEIATEPYVEDYVSKNSGISAESIGFGLSYTDNKVQLGERLEGMGMDANQVYKKDTAFIVGNYDKYVKGEKSSVFLNMEDSTTFSTRNGENTSSMGTSSGYSQMVYTNGVDSSSIRLSENHLDINYNNVGINYNYYKKRFDYNNYDYNNGEFNGEIATIPFVEDYVSKNITNEVGEVHDFGGSKFRVLNYAEDSFMIGDFEKASQNMGATVMVSDELGTVNFAYNNENGTNQASVNDKGFTMQKRHNSGRLSSISVKDGTISLALQNPAKSNTYLRLDNEEILISSIYKKYNSTINGYENILMEGSVASAKYVDTKVEELTAIIADLQKQIEELKK